MSYISTSMWFAILPLKLENGKWVWLKWVLRTEDTADEDCFGLMPTITYKLK